LGACAIIDLDLSQGVGLQRLQATGFLETAWKREEPLLELPGDHGPGGEIWCPLLVLLLATDSDIRRFRYDIEDLEGELGRIVDRGWEVGIHGGYYAYNDLEEIMREKERLERALGRKVVGYRNHYLRFCVPDSWKILEKAGFEYDTTLGYPDTVGFRNGMCHPFRPYNLRTDMEVNMLEIPMVIMDGTLFDSVRSYDEAWEVAKRLIETVAECHGVLTLNWHSNSFNCSFKTSWSRLYEKILSYCHERDAWMSSIQNFVDWWYKDEP